jgi:hypothetical protein
MPAAGSHSKRKPLVELHIRFPAGGQANKRKAGKSLKSKLSEDFPAFRLSLLSDCISEMPAAGSHSKKKPSVVIRKRAFDTNGRFSL